MNKNNDEDKILQALSGLSKLGPIIPSKGGSNAVGKLMQESLKIAHSTTKRNSLYNFTVTATSSKLNSSGRTNIFACVPNWKSSPYKSSKELVKKFGREDLSRGYSNSLFCTVTSTGPNGFGLVLRANPEKRSLQEWFVSKDEESLVAIWDISKLKEKLASLEKTAIVTALPVNIGGKKGFHYRYVDLLEKPELINFLELLESGAITIDHLISIKVGQKAAREQGPLFKVRANAREDLYKNIKRIDLMDL
ncbi:hypothetical protein HOD02_01140 [bacterium]|jgi:hypothetical protein|nr:hypothetical protein [bacterium]